MGKLIELITPHSLYQGLAKTDKTQQNRYAEVFNKRIPDHTLEEIRDSINRAWVLGDGGFKLQEYQQLWLFDLTPLIGYTYLNNTSVNEF